MVRKLAAAAIIALGIAACSAALAQFTGTLPPEVQRNMDTALDAVQCVVFSTEDSTRTYPTSPQHADSLRVQARHRCIADSAQAYHRMGTGNKVSRFAWCVVGADTNGIAPGNTMTATSLKSFWSPDSLSGSLMLNMRFRGTTQQPGNRTAVLFYVPFEQWIPAGSTIIDAKLYLVANSSPSFQNGDTLVCTLMTTVADSVWHHNTNKLGGNYPNYAMSCWNRPLTSNGGTWPSPVYDEENPALEYQSGYPYNAGKWLSRDKTWNNGLVCDWTGSTLTGANYVTSSASMPVQLTNCVQAIVNGTQNSGIVMTYHSALRSSTENLISCSFDGYSTFARRVPYFVVRYKTRPASKRWSTSDVATIITSHHTRSASSAYADTLRGRGGKLTMFASRVEVRAAETGGGGLKGSEIVAQWKLGSVEVGSSSRENAATHGLTKWVTQYAMPDTNSAAWDSLMLDVNPSWMYAMADTCSLPSFVTRNSLRFGKSLALPYGKFSPEVMLATRLTGYTAVASTPDRLANDAEKYYQPASVRPASCDSIVLGMPRQSASKPYSTAAFPASFDISCIVGRKGNTGTHVSASADSVKQNMTRALWQALGQRRGAVMLLASDTKSGSCGDGYASAAEIGKIAEATNQFGASWLFLGEYADFVRARASSAVATPVTFAQSDTVRVSPGHKVWQMDSP